MTWFGGVDVRIRHRNKEPIAFWSFVVFMYACALVIAIALWYGLKHGF